MTHFELRTRPERLRWARLAAELTQSDLADLVDRSRRSVVRWEQEEDADLDPNLLRAISAVLGLRQEWLALGQGDVWDSRVGAQVRRARVEAGRDLEWLRCHQKIPIDRLKAIECSLVEPFGSELAGIARCLRVPLDHFLPGALERQEDFHHRLARELGCPGKAVAIFPATSEGDYLVCEILPSAPETPGREIAWIHKIERSEHAGHCLARTEPHPPKRGS